MRISNSTSAAASGAVSQWQQRRQAGKDLMAALKSGDLQAAQTAYATLTQNDGGKRASHPNSLMAQLGDALKSGDLATAQKIAAGMAQHHSHHGDDDGAGGTAATPPPVPSAPTATTGNNLNVVA